MNWLTLYGLAAVSAMLMFYALEDRSAWFVLAFAGACLLASTYGFLQGAWPFGVVEVVWSAIALRRWWKRAGRHKDEGRRRKTARLPRSPDEIVGQP